jgi:hypothetical protein
LKKHGSDRDAGRKEIGHMGVDDSEQLQLVCLGARQIAEFIDATRGRQEFRDSREKAKIALAAVASDPASPSIRASAQRRGSAA